jgi:hypothetical protein
MGTRFPGGGREVEKKFSGQDSIYFFHLQSARNFSIRVRLKIFRQSPVDRHATSGQGMRDRLKFSGQGLLNYFRPGPHPSGTRGLASLFVTAQPRAGHRMPFD